MIQHASEWSLTCDVQPALLILQLLMTMTLIITVWYTHFLCVFLLEVGSDAGARVSLVCLAVCGVCFTESMLSSVLSAVCFVLSVVCFVLAVVCFVLAVVCFVLSVVCFTVSASSESLGVCEGRVCCSCCCTCCGSCVCCGCCICCSCCICCGSSVCCGVRGCWTCCGCSACCGCCGCCSCCWGFGCVWWDAHWVCCVWTWCRSVLADGLSRPASSVSFLGVSSFFLPSPARFLERRKLSRQFWASQISPLYSEAHLSFQSILVHYTAYWNCTTIKCYM